MFAQLLDFIDKDVFLRLTNKYDDNLYIKQFTCWNQLAVLMFGQLSNRIIIVRNFYWTAMMRNIFCLIVSLAVLVSCGNFNNIKTASEAEVKPENDRVEVLVFYGAQRCATCRAIEDQAKELVETAFTENLANGLLGATLEPAEAE